jgi:DNA polymerase III subunit beta
MEFTVQRSDLVKELSLVQGVVERKSSIPILSNVLLEASGGSVGFAATDLDVSLRGRCAATVAKEGSVTVGAKKMFEIARSLPEKEVKVKAVKDSWVTVECDRASFKIAGLPKEDFPSLPEAKEGKAVEIPADVLRDLIARVGFAVTAEDARYYLAGALLILEKGSVAMVATDGHRLAFASRKTELKIGDAVRPLVPRKAVAELSRLLEGASSVSFQQADAHLLFTVDGRSLSSKTVEGQFPAHERVVSASGDKVLVFDRDILAGAIRRVSLLSSERSRAIKLSLTPGTLNLSAQSPDVGEAREALAVDYKGGEVEIGFNAQYILDFLGAVGSDSVQLELKDNESQGIFKAAGEKADDKATDYRYVVMPMRL